MTTEKLNIELLLTEPLLGTSSGNKELHEEFIASKAPTPANAKEELAALPDLDEQIEKSSTIFPRNDLGIHLWDYQVKGFIKEAIFLLYETGDCDLNAYNYKRAVDNFVYIHPRIIYLLDANGAPLKQCDDNFQRPLRAMTMRGERVALARSERVAAGRKLRFEVSWLKGKPKTKLAIFNRELITNALNVGMMRGLGQWRNASHGRFSWTEIQTIGTTLPEVKPAA